MSSTTSVDLGRGSEDGSRFRRHSIFEQATAEATPASAFGTESPAWLDELREEARPGRHLALDADGEALLHTLKRGWVRIGRSAAADLRLDDATVSRRHALIVNEAGRGLRILDDRSLNGIYRNGERIDWGSLHDGDALQVGRYRLFVIDKPD